MRRCNARSSRRWISGEEPVEGFFRRPLLLGGLLEHFSVVLALKTSCRRSNWALSVSAVVFMGLLEFIGFQIGGRQIQIEKVLPPGEMQGAGRWQLPASLVE